jgi:hypothetical protein
LFIPDPEPDFYPSRIPDPVVKKVPYPRSAKLSFTPDKFQEFLLKSEPGATEPAALMRESRSAGCQTSPPPFHTEWEEAVRRTVWQPGYIPQPEPPGQFVYIPGYRKAVLSHKPVLPAVLGIRIRRIHMFLDLPDPDPLVKGPDPDPSLFS